ncbi:methyltransferase domain-containing protein [Streptomyces piniterrae]|uniref:Methyltransferase domain-containing protein n=1 Tax=Streptomyces piniterrae TaxID=2571125 RepID=A0A4U0NVD5_9ACTN|nr:methyltransferase domain-containing protein [Streptomyces piniterrae]TJZ58661.1 methyltransferase domain-containing protein [Streptomyces piniterrae]
MASAPLIELDSPAPEAVDGRQIRAVAFQGARLAYTEGALAREGRAASGRALVVGSGRGLLARGLAGLGFDVTAVDPSESATAMARAAADQERLDIDHRTAPAEHLDLPDSEFDLVYLADTLEITSAPGRVIEQAARALKPDGLLVYDTVNRTPVSRLVYLVAFQSLPMTRVMPAGRYAARRLRTPGEVAEHMARHGLHPADTCHFKPSAVRSLLTAVLARRRGRITDDQVATMVNFELAPGSKPLVTYLGYARKA